MNELVFSILRLGYLALLWAFLFLAVRALRRDVAETPSTSSSSRRRPSRPSEPSPSRSRRRSASRLLITEGPLAGSTVPLSPTSIIIGRSPSCTLVLDDSYASSRHARVFPKEGSWWLEDLGSTNGTTMNGAPVHGAVELPVNTPVRIGQTTLELRS
ncbi:FHA domain-containing protein FhaB/FipA [Actinomyces wuliandei]|uniref:FHA domain-containing protein FhaB/FipA n=1 Tax=Actinomyces wuliandei TaxID=2057743 RepID=UPI000FDA2F51|nr:FHA domain-containing protein [Actinomyces wuliandei]